MTHPSVPATCPICGGPNHCGEIDPSSTTDGRCWCATETFPPGIFKLVPPEQLNRACICKRCLDLYKQGKLPEKTDKPS